MSIGRTCFTIIVLEKGDLLAFSIIGFCHSVSVESHFKSFLSSCLHPRFSPLFSFPRNANHQAPPASLSVHGTTLCVQSTRYARWTRRDSYEVTSLTNSPQPGCKPIVMVGQQKTGPSRKPTIWFIWLLSMVETLLYSLDVLTLQVFSYTHVYL